MSYLAMVLFSATLLVLGCEAGLPVKRVAVGDICNSGCSFLKLYTEYNANDPNTIQCTDLCYKPECVDRCTDGYDLIGVNINAMRYTYNSCIVECLKKPARSSVKFTLIRIYMT